MTVRRTKIVATLGPATDRPGVLEAALRAGVDVVRINLSHGGRDDHARRLAAARHVSASLGVHVGTMIDTRGPECRLGKVAGDRVELRDGDRFDLVCDEPDLVGDARRCGVNHPGLARDVRSGDRILVDDGKIVLEVTDDPAGATVTTRVVAGGTLLGGKKVQVPGRTLSLPTLPDADAQDVAWAAYEGVDFVAASFIRDAASVLAVRRVIEEARGDMAIVAKIETAAGLDNLDRILVVCDGVMVARGDLGVALPVEAVPQAQKRIIAAARRLGKPVITATEMLESMVHVPRPTRAEATDVANAVWDGSDAVMLSAETASGEHPVEAVAFMDRICRTAEGDGGLDAYLRPVTTPGVVNATEAVSRATVQVAADLQVDAIVTATERGFTARMVARHRPRAAIVAVTPHAHIARLLACVWGVTPVVAQTPAGAQAWDHALEAAEAAGLIPQGGLAVVTGGTAVGAAGGTDLLQVRTAARLLAAGRGVGRQRSVGKVCAFGPDGPLSEVDAQSVLVAVSGDAPGFVAALRTASGAVVEAGGLTSTAAVAGISLGKPVVVGATGACASLVDGAWVTVDALRGWVFEGPARLADEPLD